MRPQAAAVAVAGCAGGTALLLWLLWKRVRAAEAEVAKYESQRLEERQGRIRAEKMLHEIVKAPHRELDGYLFRAIGTLETCFPTCQGTPRQGILTPSSAGVLKLRKEIGAAALDGLSSYSHLWLLYVFHKNTNFFKQERTHLSTAPVEGSSAGAGGERTRARDPLSKPFTFMSKVSPPPLKGKKVGVFATRSPHRPNAIGIIAVRIDRIDAAKREIYVSGLDCVDGTPVLDIKPYVSYCDSIPAAVMPDWVVEARGRVVDVSIDDGVLEELRSLVHLCKLYRDADSVLAAAHEVMSVNIRSAFQQGGIEARVLGADRTLLFDNLAFTYNADAEESSVRIIRVTADPMMPNPTTGLPVGRGEAQPSDGGGGDDDGNDEAST